MTHTETVEAIFDAVADLAPEIRSGLPGRRVAQGETNPSGETQMAADAYADERLLARLETIDDVGEYASEEREAVIDCGDGALSVAADPLDGSSNLKSNNAMGTIVGVYEGSLPAPGRDLVAAAYVLYGPITTMVAARDGEVTEAVVDDGDREVVDPDVTVPVDPTVYGFGGRVPDWTEDFATFAQEVQADESIKLRYGGAMIGDVNQVVTYGGIFSYPALQSAPEGKLRALFEAAPVAYVVETAGGRSSDGRRSLLEVDPDGLHDRVPVHLGTPELIGRLEDVLG